MTGRGHMVSGTVLIVINDRLVYHLSNKLQTMTDTLSNLGIPADFNLFETYHDFILRVWYPISWSGTWLAHFATIVELLLFLVIFWLGCFLPDIDQPNSTFGRHFYIPCKHRTWTHTIWAASLLLIPGIWIPPFFWLGYAYLLHLGVDAFSRGGVCFFYPISKYIDYPSGAHVKKHHVFKLYRPGGTSETVIVALLIVVAVMLCFGPYVITWLESLRLNETMSQTPVF